MLKIAHISDTHLGHKRYYRIAKNGHNQREVDVCITFEESINKIISLSPDLTIIAGDLFDSVRPTNYILKFCYRQIKQLAEKTKSPIIIVAGNHESPKRAETGSPLKLLEEINSVFVADFEPKQFNFPDLNLSVSTLPYLSTLNDELIASVTPNRDYKHNILITHCMVSSSRFAELTDSLDIAKLKPELWDYVALGDVHNFEMLARNTAYSGSIDNVSNNFWSEDHQKRGFLNIELPSLKIEHIKLSSPREIFNLGELTAKERSSEEILQSIKEALASIEGGIEGKIIKMSIKDIGSRQFRELEYKEIRRLKSECFHFLLDLKVEINKEIKEKIRERSSKTSLLNELKSFVVGKTETSGDIIELIDQGYTQVLVEEEGEV